MSIFEQIKASMKASFEMLYLGSDNIKDEKDLSLQVTRLEEAILSGQSYIAIYQHTTQTLHKQVEAYQEKMSDLDNEAAEAVSRGDDDAARKALSNKMRLQASIDNLDPEIKTAQAQQTQMKQQVQQLEDELRKTKIKISEFNAREQLANAQSHFNKQTSLSNDESPLSHRQEEVMLNEAKSEIESKINAPDAGFEAKLHDLKVEDALAELKAKKDEA